MEMQDVKPSLEQEAEKKRQKKLKEYKVNKIADLQEEIEREKEYFKEIEKRHKLRVDKIKEEIEKVKKKKTVPREINGRCTSTSDIYIDTNQVNPF